MDSIVSRSRWRLAQRNYKKSEKVGKYSVGYAATKGIFSNTTAVVFIVLILWYVGALKFLKNLLGWLPSSNQEAVDDKNSAELKLPNSVTYDHFNVDDSSVSSALSILTDTMGGYYVDLSDFILSVEKLNKDELFSLIKKFGVRAIDSPGWSNDKDYNMITYLRKEADRVSLDFWNKSEYDRLKDVFSPLRVW